MSSCRDFTTRFAQQPIELRLALQQWEPPQVLAAQLKQIEGEYRRWLRARRVIDREAFQRLVEPNAMAERSELGVSNAVARLMLSRIQDRLPQWAAVHAGGSVILGRKQREPRARQIDPLPQFLFEINWADSGPGFSWPEAYHVIYVPGFQRYVVAASADSTEAYGYVDIAIGWFSQCEGRIEGSKRVILDWWGECRDRGHEGWAYLFNTGLVGKAEALQWKDEIWAGRDSKSLVDNGKSVSSRRQLEASKPQRGEFSDEEAFEEALGRWMENQGRILGLTGSSKSTSEEIGFRREAGVVGRGPVLASP